MSREVDDSTVGKKDLANTDPASGSAITNIQRELNKLNSFNGSTPNTAFDTTPTWTNNDVGASTDSVKLRADNLTAEFNMSTGHSHNGGAGEGAPITNFPDLTTFEEAFALDSFSTAGGGTIMTLASTQGIQKITGTGATTIESMLAPSPEEGRFIIIHNDTDSDVTILHENAGSTAIDRFFLVDAANMTVSSQSSAIFVYDVDDNRWKSAASSGSGGANKFLSNLTSPTAINEDLIFDTGTTAAVQTKDFTGATEQIEFKSGDSTTSGATGPVIVQSGAPTSGMSGYVGIYTGNTTGANDSGVFDWITGTNNGTGNTGAPLLASGDKSGTSGNSGDLTIASGSHTATTGSSGLLTFFSGTSTSGNSGNVLLTTGDANSGTSGSIRLTVGAGSSQGDIRFFKTGVASVAGQVWTATGTAGQGYWANAVGNYDYETVSSFPFSATTANDIITADVSGGAGTINLFTAVGNEGKALFIQKIDTTFNAVTIDPNGAQTIGGAATTTLNTFGESVMIVSDNSNWIILKRTIPSTWTAFTPTGSWVTNTTYTGFWKRIGDSIDLAINLTLAGAPTAATLTVNIPSGLTMDTAKFPATIQNDNMNLGLVELQDSGTNSYFGNVAFNSTTSVAPQYFAVTGGLIAPGAITNVAPFTFASGDEIGIKNMTLPISGWNG